MTARYAVYFVPEPDTSLWVFGTRVLGYDTYSGQSVRFFEELPTVAPDWKRFVQQPAVYGFHATLKAPFHLAPGKTEEELLSKVNTTAASLPRVALGYLRVEVLGRFLTLRPEASSPDLKTLEAQLVTRLDDFRAPPGAQECARRRPATLTERQRHSLSRWGYPFCLEDFRFHMTLTGPLEDGEREQCLPALSMLYSPVNEPVRIVNVAVLKQSCPDLPFRVLRTFRIA